MRTRFTVWRNRRAAWREFEGETEHGSGGPWSVYRFERDAIAATAAVLEMKWDHTGFRLLGVPPEEFVMFASSLVDSVGRGATDGQLATRLAELEADLGLRESPSEHRLQVAAALRRAASVSR